MFGTFWERVPPISVRNVPFVTLDNSAASRSRLAASLVRGSLSVEHRATKSRPRDSRELRYERKRREFLTSYKFRFGVPYQLRYSESPNLRARGQGW